MKRFFWLICLLIPFVLKAQNGKYSTAIAELKRTIERKIDAPEDLLAKHQSAVVLVSVSLSKSGNLKSAAVVYNEQSDTYRIIAKTIKSIRPATWKKFKGIENILIPVFLAYDDEVNFCFDWNQFNPQKMEQSYYEGLYLKPLIIFIGNPKRVQ